ncbi:MAG TPA: putative Ig domain-containing protein [Bryobacteraceae bacterium]|nr:putative Ig domain-containing protein [Bryobacteraceae bacterium]
MRVRRTCLLTAMALILPAILPAQIRTNAAFRQKEVPRNDDGSAPLEPLGWTLNFFGRLRTAVFVNNNGNITFDAALPTYTPFGLNGVSREIIAPFFADVDTRSSGSQLVTYGSDTIDGRRAFGVNYVDVGYYNQHHDKTNSFQVVLIERPDTGEGNFDIEFNYARITWETGDASGGTNGFGGVPASVGWSNGSGLPGTSFELTGSLVAGAFLDSGPYSLVRNRTAGVSGRSGRWTFRARGGTVIPPLSISTGCPIPNASAGRPYALQFAAAGSRPPYRWTAQADPDSALPNVSMTAAGNLTGTPPAPGEFAFTVRVSATDEDGEVSVSRRCTVTVDPPSLSIITNTALPSTGTGSAYLARLRAEGSTNPVRFDLYQSAPVPGLTLDPNGTISGTPTIPGTYQFQVRARSEGGDQAVPAIKRFSVSVHPAAVSIRGLCPLPNGTGGVPYSHQFAAQGGTGPYRWSISGAPPTGLSLTADGLLAGIPRVPHWWPFTVQVADSRGGSSELACGVVILFPEVTVASACPLPSAIAGSAYSQRLTAAGGAAPYTWSAIGNLPPGLSVNPEGILTGTPLVSGASQFRLKVTDGRGQAASTACSVSVLQGASYAVTSCPLPNAYVGESYSQRLFVNGGIEPFLWNPAASLPAGLRLSVDGYLSGMLNTAGTFPVSLKATDATGQAAIRTCNLVVLPQALRLTNSCPLPDGSMGQAYASRLAAAGGVEPYSFFVRGDLPPGVRLAENGAFIGTPTQAGLFPVQITVRDRNNQSAASACSIAIGIPTLPAIRVTGLPAALPPASTGPRITIELGAAYPLAIDGEATVTVDPDTNNSLSSVNRADPSVRFNNGQRTIPFSIPAGSRSATLQLNATGTVASTITVSVSKLRTGGVDLTSEASAVARISRLAPVLTNVCYAPTTDGFDVDISGYSTTRELNTAALTFGANTYTVDLTGSALEYFASDDSVRTGGTFRIRAPYRLTQGSAQTLGQGTAIIRNTAGSSPSRSITRCQ